MSKRFDFWTHGIATILENPGIAGSVLHNGLGTTVEQGAGTEAWFHIPIPTPTIMEGDNKICLRLIALRAKVNENATVDGIHIRRGADFDPVVVAPGVNFTNTTIVYDLGNLEVPMAHQPQMGLVMCIHVKFLTGEPRGRVEFQGAGGVFS